VKVLILGTSGFLGSYLFDKLKKEFKVFNTGIKKRNIDLTNFDEIEHKIITVKPNLIINSSGLANIEHCEKNINKSKKINVNILNHIFLIKKKYDLRYNVIHFSTDQVYNPKKNIKNKEMKYFKPINIYSKHKLMSEKICLKNKALVFRINILGKSHYKKDKFTDWIFDSFIKNDKIKGFSDSFYSPLCADTISAIILKCIKKKYYLFNGIYNLGSNNGISKYKLILLFSKKLNIYQKKLLNNSKINDFYKTNRTRYNRMNVSKFEKKFHIKLPTTLREIINVTKSYDKN
jgi:dTDP-4-dehydrorhamnose reductase